MVTDGAGRVIGVDKDFLSRDIIIAGLTSGWWSGLNALQCSTWWILPPVIGPLLGVQNSSGIAVLCNEGVLLGGLV